MAGIVKPVIDAGKKAAVVGGGPAGLSADIFPGKSRMAGSGV